MRWQSLQQRPVRLQMLFSQQPVRPLLLLLPWLLQQQLLHGRLSLQQLKLQLLIDGSNSALLLVLRQSGAAETEALTTLPVVSVEPRRVVASGASARPGAQKAPDVLALADCGQSEAKFLESAASVCLASVQPFVGQVLKIESLLLSAEAMEAAPQVDAALLPLEVAPYPQ